MGDRRSSFPPSEKFQNIFHIARGNMLRGPRQQGGCSLGEDRVAVVQARQGRQRHR